LSGVHINEANSGVDVVALGEGGVDKQVLVRGPHEIDNSINCDGFLLSFRISLQLHGWKLVD